MTTKRPVIHLAPRAESILRLEEFVDTCSTLTGKVRLRLKLAATEVFENILMHNRSLFKLPVTMYLCEKDTPKLYIRYFSCPVRSFTLPESRLAPYYDPVTRRYRGLGLRMCNNLSRSIVYRKSLFTRVIIIIL